MNKIDNIKNLWDSISYKTGFIEKAAEAFGKSKNTLHNHWFARWWSIPETHQDEVISFMQKYIKHQEDIKEIEVNGHKQVK